MRGIRGFLLFLFLLSFGAQALEVAFFIKRNINGEIEVLETGSLYSHVAMKVGDQWLNAHPWRGIELTDDLDGMGQIAEVLSNPAIAEPDQAFLEQVLGKRFFVFADWHDPEVFNCTKLVGKFLGLEPLPMYLEPEVWGDRFTEYNGRPGLSPGELYEQLGERDFHSSSTCLNRLKRAGR